MKKRRQKNLEGGQRKKHPNTLVRVYNLILTFDTDVENSHLDKEISKIIEQINRILSINMRDSLPQFFKNENKESRISVSYNKDDD